MLISALIVESMLVVGIELRGQGQNDLIACLCARLRVSQIPLLLYTALKFPNEPTDTSCDVKLHSLRVSECLASVAVRGCKQQQEQGGGEGLRHLQPASSPDPLPAKNWLLGQ